MLRFVEIDFFKSYLLSYIYYLLLFNITKIVIENINSKMSFIYKGNPYFLPKAECNDIKGPQ